MYTCISIQWSSGYDLVISELWPVELDLRHWVLKDKTEVESCFCLLEAWACIPEPIPN